MHLAGRYDFTCNQGATFDRTVTWKDADGSPVDVSGFTARMHVRRSAQNPQTQAELASDDGSIVLGGAAGTVQLILTAAQTAALPAAPLVYDLELTAPSGTVTRLIEGRFNIKANVTR